MSEGTIVLKHKASWSKPAGLKGLIGRKKVDWSIFQDGTPIPAEFHEDFEEANHYESILFAARIFDGKMPLAMTWPRRFGHWQCGWQNSPPSVPQKGETQGARPLHPVTRCEPTPARWGFLQCLINHAASQGEKSTLTGSP